MSHLRRLITGTLSALFLGLLGGLAEAGDALDRVRAIDRDIAALDKEIANQDKVIGDMQRIVDDSRKPGGVAPDPKKLQPMGRAGVGVVGEGLKKPQVVRDIVAGYESKANPANWLDIGRLATTKNDELDRQREEYNKQNGLPADTALPADKVAEAEAMAAGRSVYRVEISRSERLRSLFRGRKANLEKEKQRLLAEMSDEDKSGYEDTAAAEPPAEDEDEEPVTAAGEPSPEPEPEAAEVEPPEEEPLPDTRLVTEKFESIVGPLRNRISAMESELARICAGSEGGAARIEAAIAASKANLDALVAAHKPPELGAALVGLDRLADLAGAVSRIADKAQEASGSACTLSAATPVDLDGARAQSARLENLVALADAVASEAAGVGRGLLTQLDGWKVENPEIPRAGIEAASAPINQACKLAQEGQTAINEAAGRYAAQGPFNASQSVAEATRELAFSIPGLERTDAGQIEARYKAEAADIDRRSASASRRVGKCAIDMDAAQSRCQDATNEFLEYMPGTFPYMGDLGVGKELEARRQQARANIEAYLTQIGAALDRMAALRKAGDLCVETASAGAADPQLSAEADSLGDPSTVACSGAAYDGRVAELRDARFASVPGIEAKIAELQRIRAALAAAVAANNAAEAAYKAGDLNAARARLADARAAFNSAGGKAACGDLDQQITRRTATVAQLGDEIAAAESAAATCDIGSMKRLVLNYEVSSQPNMRAAMARLNEKLPTCEAEAEAQEQARAEAQQASNNGVCTSKFGGGYYAGKANSAGTFSCLPTQATANAWCANKNGSGTVAKNIRADGTWDCVFTSARQRADAVAWCKRQYGRNYVKTIRSGGQYRCVYNTGRSASGGQPSYNPNDAAAAAAAIGTMIGIIAGSQGGGGGHGGGHSHGTGGVDCRSNPLAAGC